MENHLDETLKIISQEFRDQIAESSRYYLEVDIGRRGGQLGYSDVEKKFRAVQAVVPLRQAQRGMKVRIDGRTFVNYGQLDSGVAVPGHVVRESRLPYRTYVAQDSMILNFV